MLAALLPVAAVLLPLAALPVVVHLLTRGRVVTRRFPPLAFLLTAQAGRARRDRLRERMVLTLRCLALALALAAAAGPLWRGFLAGDQATPVVIILDASASMRQVGGGSSAFSRARAAAGRIAEQLGNRPACLMVSGGARQLSGQPAVERGPLRALLAEAEANWSDGDPAAALAAAALLLPDGGEIVMVTDLARGSLAGVDPTALPNGVRLRVVDAGGAGDNAAVTGLAIEPGVVVAGRPATLTARVANYGKNELRGSLALRAGAAATMMPVTIAAGETVMLRHRFTSESAGWVAMEAELTVEGSDALTEDNRRVGAIEVLPALTAVIATDRDRDDPVGAVRPLTAAFAAAGITVRHSDGAGLASELSADGKRPWLAVTVGLGDVVAGPALQGHLSSGGAWLQVAVSDSDAALSLPNGPAPLAGQVDVSAQERGESRITQAKLDHPLLQPFVGREVLLTSLSAWRYRLTPQGPAADAAAVLAYGDGTLALAERPAGGGRWLTLNLSPAAADSGLAASEVLPLLIAHLPEALLPAQADRLARDAGAVVPSAVPLTTEDGIALAVVDGTVRLQRPGIHRAKGGALVAAAVPALESDLRPLAAERLGVAVSDAAGAVRAATTTPLWPWLLAAAVIFLAAEMVLAGGLEGRPLWRKRS